MSSLHSSLYRSVLVLAILSWAQAEPLFNLVAKSQERSREEASKEAGRLGTEAERLRGEAYKKVQAGGDRGLILEAELVAAEKFRQAIELWRAAGDDKRLIAGVEELTRIYSVVGDYDGAVGCLRREAEFWGERGDLPRQAHTLWLMGLRQMQMRRDTPAAETFEQVVEMSRAAGLFSVERNALEDLARLYDKFGRGKEAESCRERSKELLAQVTATPAEVVGPSRPATVPAQWLDLPTAPLVAEYREVNGVKQAVLVNRSTKGIEWVTFGCVAENGGKTRVLNGLIGKGLNHGGVGPGLYYMPFSALNGPLNQWTDEKMGCEGAAKIALIEATSADGTIWKADGVDWVVR